MSVTAVGLKETKAFLASLRTGIPRSISNALTSAENLAEMEARARADVEDIVYSVPETENYKRTFEFLNAIGAFGSGGSPCFCGVAINLTPGVKAIYTDRQVSYARYFLPEESAESFHQYSLPRDFLSVWHSTFALLHPQLVIDAIDRELHK